MDRRWWWLLGLVICLSDAAAGDPAAGTPAAGDPAAGDPAAGAYEPSRFFRSQILPILKHRCYECHSEEEGQDDGGLVLDSRSGWERGGDHGPAVVPKDLGKSPLVRAILSHDPGSLMPPDDPLPAIEIALIQTWVLLGAPDPRP